MSGRWLLLEVMDGVQAGCEVLLSEGVVGHEAVFLVAEVGQPAEEDRQVDLVVPAVGYLESYAEALSRGWSPDTIDPDASRQQLAQIRADPVGFIEELDDLEGKAGPVVLPDGSTVRRLPSFRRWMWDEAFVGSIGFRWQPGTAELPPYVLGHIGYSVVPWARRRGYATGALRQLLTEVTGLGLPHVDLTTNLDNIASQKVIAANGGVLVERFTKPADYGAEQEALRWRIALQP